MMVAMMKMNSHCTNRREKRRRELHRADEGRIRRSRPEGTQKKRPILGHFIHQLMTRLD
jgi:hypothetical protein